MEKLYEVINKIIAQNIMINSIFDVDEQTLTNRYPVA